MILGSRYSPVPMRPVLGVVCTCTGNAHTPANAWMQAPPRIPTRSADFSFHSTLAVLEEIAEAGDLESVLEDSEIRLPGAFPRAPQGRFASTAWLDMAYSRFRHPHVKLPVLQLVGQLLRTIHLLGFCRHCWFFHASYSALTKLFVLNTVDCSAFPCNNVHVELRELRMISRVKRAIYRVVSNVRPGV